MQHHVDKEWSINPTALSWEESAMFTGKEQSRRKSHILPIPSSLLLTKGCKVQQVKVSSYAAQWRPSQCLLCFFFFLRTEMRLFRPLGNKPFGGTEVFWNGGIYFGIEVSIFSFQKTKQGRICDFAQIMAFSDFLL